jgi:putative membrane protein
MLWLKWLHIVFMVTWFAGLFYLPRLFVYHAMSEDAASRERFKIMERKLYYGIMAPGALLTVLFGLWLWLGHGPWGYWVHAKFALVLVLIAYHLYCGRLLKAFCAGPQHQNPRLVPLVQRVPGADPVRRGVAGPLQAVLMETILRHLPARAGSPAGGGVGRAGRQRAPRPSRAASASPGAGKPAIAPTCGAGWRRASSGASPTAPYKREEDIYRLAHDVPWHQRIFRRAPDPARLRDRHPQPAEEPGLHHPAHQGRGVRPFPRRDRRATERGHRRAQHAHPRLPHR